MRVRRESPEGCGFIGGKGVREHDYMLWQKSPRINKVIKKKNESSLGKGTHQLAAGHIVSSQLQRSCIGKALLSF